MQNLSKYILELLKRENRHLRRLGTQDEFVISREQWRDIDSEILQYAKGTSESVFGLAPRITTCWRSSKVSELRAFFCNYALVLIDGYLSGPYLKGLSHFCTVVELCRRTSLTAMDLNDLEKAANSFYLHMQREYFRYNERRVGVMRSTVHSLLHLRGQVERYGPMTNYNQFWVERQIGRVKSRLNTTRLPAESMTENAKLFESFKLFHSDHFVEPDDENLDHSGHVSHSKDIMLLTPCDKESLRDPVHSSYGTKRLLKSYFIRTGRTPNEASQMVSIDDIWCFGRARIPCGQSWQVVGALKARRHRHKLKRGDYYVAAEFSSPTQENSCTVHYGHVLKFLRYNFGSESRAIVLMEWAENLRVNTVGQVSVTHRKPQHLETLRLKKSPLLLMELVLWSTDAPDVPDKRFSLTDNEKLINCYAAEGKSGRNRTTVRWACMRRRKMESGAKMKRTSGLYVGGEEGVARVRAGDFIR